MNKDKYVFAQIVEYLDYFKFRRLVEKYRGDAHVKHFSCWHQLLTLMFGQLSGRKSLRDLTTVLEAPAEMLPSWTCQQARVKKHAFGRQPESRLPHLRGVCLLHDG